MQFISKKLTLPQGPTYTGLKIIICSYSMYKKSELDNRVREKFEKLHQNVSSLNQIRDDNYCIVKHTESDSYDKSCKSFDAEREPYVVYIILKHCVKQIYR